MPHQYRQVMHDTILVIDAHEGNYLGEQKGSVSPSNRMSPFEIVEFG